MKMFLMAAAIAATGASANAAEFSHYYNGEGNAVISISGDIRTGDARNFKRLVLDVLVNDLQGTGHYVSGVALNTPGGNTSEGYEIAEMVKGLKTDTIVPRNHLCASACFMIFAAGQQKWVGQGARVGVHSASNQYGVETTGANTVTVAMSRYLKRLNVPEQIIGKMVATPNGDIAWLDNSDLAAMNARVTAGRSRSAPAAQEYQADSRSSEGDAFVRSYKLPMYERDKKWTSFVENIKSSPWFDKPSDNFVQFCERDYGTCTKGLYYKSVKGQMLALEVSDYDGKLKSRTTCYFPQTTVRICQDFDRGNLWRDITTVSGKWEQVESEAPPQ